MQEQNVTRSSIQLSELIMIDELTSMVCFVEMAD